MASQSQPCGTPESVAGEVQPSAAERIAAWLQSAIDQEYPAEGWVGRAAKHIASGLAEEAAETPSEKADPNPEWEAKADAAHAAIVAEVGHGNPFDTLTMLETWKAHAEPADCDGRITFSRAMLDSAQDALRMALEMARSEHLQAKRNFIAGAQECREMLARFVEQGGGPVRGGIHVLIAQSIRANWNPSWGDDPGPPHSMRDRGWMGPDLHDKAVALQNTATPEVAAEGGAYMAGSGSAINPSPTEPSLTSGRQDQ